MYRFLSKTYLLILCLGLMGCSRSCNGDDDHDPISLQQKINIRFDGVCGGGQICSGRWIYIKNNNSIDVRIDANRRREAPKGTLQDENPLPPIYLKKEEEKRVDFCSIVCSGFPHEYNTLIIKEVKKL